MKKFYLCLFLLSIYNIQAQNETKKYFSIDAGYFYGSIIEHNPHISHLITGHPQGIILSLNQKTYGLDSWEAEYNYPNVGVSFTYQDMKNPYLDDNYGLYGHMGFYFLKRHLVFKVGQGLALNSNPYHPDDNYLNNAYGSRIMSSTFFSGNFQKENIFKGLGFQAGLAMIHYSNADFKSPNNSTNTFVVNAGFNYLFNASQQPEYIPKDRSQKFAEPVHYNFVMRGGSNTIGIIGSKSYPFLTLSAYADKRINRKSTFQAGAEFFLSGAMEEFIYYQSVTFPRGRTTGDEDAKRVGVFLGHQLSFNKLSLITQLGYYAYYPYDNYVDRLYNRVGLQRVIYKDLFGSVTVLAHGANAEAVEFSLGYRL